MSLGFHYLVHRKSAATCRSNVTHSQGFQKQAQADNATTVILAGKKVVAKQ